MDNKIYLSWADAHRHAHHIALDVTAAELHIHRIVGIARGGLIPAVILSHALKLPLTSVDYSSPDGAGDDKRLDYHLPSSFPADNSILVVDDISDTGRTLLEVKEFYTLRGYRVHTAALLYKELDNTPPDFYGVAIGHDAPWIAFPWE